MTPLLARLGLFVGCLALALPPAAPRGMAIRDDAEPAVLEGVAPDVSLPPTGGDNPQRGEPPPPAPSLWDALAGWIAERIPATIKSGEIPGGKRGGGPDGPPELAFCFPNPAYFVGEGYAGGGTVGGFGSPTRGTVATGDLNGDGFDDLVTSVSRAASVEAAVFLNNGDRTFAAPVRYRTHGTNQVNYVVLALADIDDDGDLDIVAYNCQRTPVDSVATLLNNGGGQFGSPAEYELSSSSSSPPYRIIAADLDGENGVDIAMPITQTSQVAVLFNQGTGLFPSVAYFPTAASPLDIASGYFDDDDLLDLALCCCTSPACGDSGSTGNVTVLLNNFGDFSSRRTDYEAGIAPGAIVAAELNEDGRIDLAVVGFNGTYNSISLLFAHPTVPGVFLPREQIATGGHQANGIGAADLNSDGLFDLAVIHEDNEGGARAACAEQLVIHFNNATNPGVFQTPVAYGTARAPRSIAFSDLDHDGSTDVALLFKGAGASVGGLVGLHFNQGDGAFEDRTPVTWVEQPSIPTIEVDAVAVDFDRDGDPDVAVIGDGAVDVVYILRNDAGALSWAINIPLVPISNPIHILAGELDCVPGPDLAVIGSAGNVQICLNNGVGAFVPPTASSTYFAGTAANCGELADIDGDGDLDIVIGRLSNPGLGVLRNRGDGSFESVPFPPHEFSGVVAGMAVADFDGDGDFDIAAISNGNDARVRILLQDSGGFNVGQVIDTSSSGDRLFTIAAADMDGDGDQDLVTLSREYDAYVIRNSGSAFFTLAPPYTVPDGVSQVGVYYDNLALADIDSDGNPDVIWTNVFRDHLLVARNRGNGTLERYQLFEAGRNPGGFALADLNSDGRLDVVITQRDPQTRCAWVLYSQCGNGGPPLPPDPELRDCNANGRPDECDIADETSQDSNSDGVPDECQTLDLLVSAIDTGLLISDGQALTVAGDVMVRIENGGALPAIGQFQIALFDDRDGDGAYAPATDILLGGGAQDGLAAGGNILLNVPISGAQDFRADLIYAFVDSGGAINETTETNNYANSGQFCRTGAPGSESPAPDLAASFVRIEQDAVNGVRITARIGNGGATAAPAGVVASFFDGAPAGGLRLGTANTTAVLPPGRYEDVALTLPYGTETAGFVWAVADDSVAGGTHVECDESNNAHNSGLQLIRPNQPPVAHAGGPYEAAECTTIEFDGSASTDPDGDALTFAWDLDGDGEYDDSTDPAPLRAFNANGSFTTRLIVSDGRATSVPSAAVTVTIRDASPTITLRGPRTPNIGEPGEFEADAATPCDAITRIEWDWDFDGSTFAPSGNEGPTQMHAFAAQGAYRVAARVTDEDGSQATWSEQVSVVVPGGPRVAAGARIEILIGNRDYSVATQVHRGEFTLINRTTQPIRGPIALAFDHILPTNVTLLPSDVAGTVPHPTESSRSILYVDFSEFLSDGYLAPGASAGPKWIHFSAPGNAAFTFETIAYLFNAPPRFTSTPLLVAEEGRRYRHDVDVVDDDGDVVTFELVLTNGVPPPADMTIHPDSGLIDWTPGQLDAGDHDVTVLARDGLEGGESQQPFPTIRVGAVNVAPRITSPPRATALVAEQYTYQVSVEDEDGDTLNHALPIAPTGMTINPTGLIEWLPSAPGDVNVLVEVDDGHGHQAVQSYVLTVLACADPPLIESTPFPPASEGQLLEYQITVDNPGGQPLTYSLPVAPDGMTISPTGRIRWTPSFTQAGPRVVKVIAAVNNVCFDERIIRIDVQSANAAPRFISQPVETAAEGTVYRYSALATDADGEAVTYRLIQGPDGMIVNPLTGEVQWVVSQTAATYSPYTVVLAAVDPEETVGQQTFPLTVTPANLGPQIVSIPNYVAIEGELYQYQVVASDADGPADEQMYSIIPPEMTISSTGLVQWTPDQRAAQRNPHRVAITVRDSGGLEYVQRYELFVRAVNVAPVMNSTPDATIAEGELFEYTASATDPDGDALTFTLAPDAPPDMSVFSTSDLQSDRIEWQVPQTAAANSPYTIRITASDGPASSPPQSFLLTVTPVNVAPVFDPVSPAALQAGTDATYRYTAHAVDPDGDAPRYELPAGEYPDGMVIDPMTGEITWTPIAAQLGDNSVAVLAIDPANLSARLDYNIRVTDCAGRPQFFSTPRTTARVDSPLPYLYDANATTPDGANVTYGLGPHPAGLSIDTSSGLVTWSPAADQVGLQHVVVTAARENDPACTTEQPFDIDVRATCSIEISYDLPTLSPGTPATLTPTLISSCEPARYSLQPGSAAGATIDADTGVVRWTPIAGPFQIIVRVTDAWDASDTYTIAATVEGHNPPQLAFAPLRRAVVDFPYVCRVRATDLDGSSLAFTLAPLPPAGMTIVSTGPATAEIRWIPVASQLGEHEVTVIVTDDNVPAPLTDQRTFTIEVADAVDADIQRPEVVVTAEPRVVNAGEPVTITASAIDDFGIQSLVLTVNGAPVALDPSGQAVYTPPQPGAYIAVACATDVGQNSTTATTDFRARLPGDDSPPVVEILPLTGEEGVAAEVTAPTDLLGRVQDDNLYKYTLAYRQPGDSDFAVFYTGYETVPDGGLLGVFDPSLLLNGLYEIRLQAEDLNGNLSDPADITVVVTGNLKVGNFTISLTDLSVPVSGIPITITRTYDSRDKSVGDFGIGWRMEIASLKVQESRILGKDWKQLRIAGFFPTYVLSPIRDPIVSLTMPDGRLERFRMQPVPSQQTLFPIEIIDDVVFTPVPPTTGTLVVLSGAPDRYVGTIPEGGLPGFGDIVNFDDDGPGYDPTTYLLTRRDGTELYFTGAAGSRTAKLQRIRDRSGNELTFTANAVTSSTGKTVQIEREDGRIERIIDPNGEAIRFEYDDRGDLVRSFAAGAAEPTEYEYDDRHNLIDIRDPLGVSVQRNEYDEDGRLVAVVDALGNRVAFTHDVDGQQEVVRDARGNLARYVYDDRGNVALEEKFVTIDGVLTTASTLRTYDANGNELTRIDPDGLLRTREYEANACGVCTEDFTREVIDPHESPGDAHLNIETRNSYDGFGNLIQTIDALGRVTTTTYNNQGNPSRIALPGGGEFTTVYNFQTGDPLQLSDPSGSTTLNTYSQDGYLTRAERLDANGARLSLTSYTYDNNGNRRTETVERTIDGSLVALTTTYEYDASNRVVRVTDPHDRVSRTEYNDAGQKTADIRDAGPGGLNLRTEYEHDDAGRQTLTRFPDGTTRRTEYDESGNTLREFGPDPAQPPTQYEYDELNRRVKTIYPGPNNTTSFSQTIYSPGGRVMAEIDRRGNRTDYEYDTAGRQTAVIQPAAYDYNTGQTGRPRHTSEYDLAGNRTAAIDANNHRTEFFYDDANRLVRTRFHNGTEQRRVYDNASRLIEEIDQAGRSKRYDYDGAGRLIAVTLPPPNPGDPAPITRYTYDEAGNQLTQTDALGRTTRFAYDELGRRVKRTLPLGMFETSEYDTVGNLAAHTDFNGDTIRYFYDEMNRLVRKELPVGSAGTEIDGLQPVPPSASDKTGAGLFVLNREQTQLTVTYQTTILPSEITAARIRSAAPGANGPVVFDLPTGEEQVTTTVAVSAAQVQELLTGDWYIEVVTASFPAGEIRGQIKALTPGVVTYTYTPTGQRETVTDDRGVTSYEYDENDRLKRITQPFGNTTAVIDYTWDANGNRLSITHPAQTVTYEYDALNRLARVLAPEGVYEYKYDLAGNRRFLHMANNTTTEWQYDTLNRLTHIYHRNPAGEIFASYIYTLDLTGKRIRVDEFPTRSVDYAYDGMDRLIRETMHEGDGSTMTIAYTYDAVGNRLRRVLVGPGEMVTTDYEYDDNDRLLIETQSTTFAHLLPGHDARRLCARADRFATPSQTSRYVLNGFLTATLLLTFTPFLSFVFAGRRGRSLPWRGSVAWLLIPIMLLTPESFLRLEFQAQAAVCGPRHDARIYVFEYDRRGAQVSRSSSDRDDHTIFDVSGCLTARILRLSTRELQLFQHDDVGDRITMATKVTVSHILVDSLNHTEFSQSVEECSGNAAEHVVYSVGDDLLATTRASMMSYFHTDAQMSVRTLTSGDGDLTDSYTYNAFGHMLTRVGGTPNAFGYAGERFDVDAGTYHLRARHYHPDSARFQSPDPFRGFRRDPHSLHKYVYCRNAPIDCTDPSGQLTLIEALLVVAVLAIIAVLAIWMVNLARNIRPARILQDLAADSQDVTNGVISTLKKATDKKRPDNRPDRNFGTWMEVADPFSAVAGHGMSIKAFKQSKQPELYGFVLDTNKNIIYIGDTRPAGDALELLAIVLAETQHASPGGPGLSDDAAQTPLEIWKASLDAADQEREFIKKLRHGESA